MLTHFEDNNPISNATVLMEVCRDEYVRAGLREDAAALSGLEIIDEGSAQLAWLTLRSLPKRTPEIEDMRQYALVALQSAIRCSVLRIAS